MAWNPVPTYFYEVVFTLYVVKNETPLCKKTKYKCIFMKNGYINKQSISWNTYNINWKNSYNTCHWYITLSSVNNRACNLLIISSCIVFYFIRHYNITDGKSLFGDRWMKTRLQNLGIDQWIDFCSMQSFFKCSIYTILTFYRFKKNIFKYL